MLNAARKKCINKLLNRYEREPSHAGQVKKLALLIFDKTKNVLHNFSDKERDLLETAALLHDIGYSVSSENHSKYSYKLITAELEGFTPEETEIIGNIARYHRGKKPKESHKCFSKLPDKKTKTIVKKLGAICRMADGFDRSHLSLVEDIDCMYDSFSEVLYFIIKLTVPDCGLEIWAAEKKKNMFEDEFNVRVRFRIK